MRGMDAYPKAAMERATKVQGHDVPGRGWLRHDADHIHLL